MEGSIANFELGSVAKDLSNMVFPYITWEPVHRARLIAVIHITDRPKSRLESSWAGIAATELTLHAPLQLQVCAQGGHGLRKPRCP